MIEKINDSSVENEVPIPSRIKSKKISPIVYRQGRFAKLFYIENNQFPIDFRNMKIRYDANVDNELSEIRLGRALFSEERSPMIDFIGKYGIWLLIGAGVIIGLILILQGGNPNV